jgi:predicted transcriptional regulator
VNRPRENRLPKTARDFRALLEAAELSQESAADLLGISARTVRGYADGSRPIPDLVIWFVKAYMRFGNKAIEGLKK